MDFNASKVDKGIRELLSEIAIQRMNISKEPLYWLKNALASRKIFKNLSKCNSARRIQDAKKVNRSE